MRGFLVTILLPPTGLLLLVIVGLLLLSRYRRFGYAISLISLLLLLLLGMPGLSGTLLLGLEGGLPTIPTPDHIPRAIVILGGDKIRTHEENLGARPGVLTLERLQTGAALYRRTHLPILVTGGTTQDGSAAVGLVMEQSLTHDFQVPVRWTEARSADTWENARFSADILRTEGITSVYIVTHPWHMRRAVLAFRGTGLTVTAAPTPLDEPVQPILSDFLPRAAGWQTAYYAVHEWIGYVWYSIR